MKNKLLSAFYILTSFTAATGFREISAQELPEFSVDEILDTAIDSENVEDILIGAEGFFILPESFALVPDASDVFADYDDIPAIFIAEDTVLGATLYQQTLASGGMLKGLCDKIRKICGIRPAPKKPTPRDLEKRCENLETERNKAECRVKELEDSLRRKKIESTDLRRRNSEEISRMLKRTRLFSKCLVSVLPTIIRPFDTTTCEIARREIGKCAGWRPESIEIKEFLCGPFPACCPRARD
jgi:hypothetical protein